MRFLVCLKQVPDSTVKVKVGGGGKAIATEGITWSMSPYDEYAVELALERKDADPTTLVSVVTVGSARGRDALRQALAMGCDDATLVNAPEDLPALDVAKALAAVAKEMKPDIVLCGKQASDDDQGLVGPAIAEFLGWPHVGMLTKAVPSGDAWELWREVEGGHEVWKAKKKEIPEKDLASLRVTASSPKIEVVAMELPPQRGGGKIFKLDGDAKGVAERVAKALHEEAKVL